MWPNQVIFNVWKFHLFFYLIFDCFNLKYFSIVNATHEDLPINTLQFFYTILLIKILKFWIIFWTEFKYSKKGLKLPFSVLPLKVAHNSIIILMPNLLKFLFFSFFKINYNMGNIIYRSITLNPYSFHYILIYKEWNYYKIKIRF